MATSTTPQQIVAELGLVPLPVEGGMFAQSWRDQTCSAIYYLITAPEFSALHQLDRLELYSYHAGAPARTTVLDGTSVREHLLGPDLTAGHRPQLVVPAGAWQATETLGEWTLLGTVVVPPYTDDCVRFADVAALAARYPSHAERIRALGAGG